MANSEKAKALDAAQLHILKAISGLQNASGPTTSKSILSLASAYALLEGSVKPVSAYEQED